MVLGPTMTMVCSVGGAVADGSVVDSEKRRTSVEDSSEEIRWKTQKKTLQKRTPQVTELSSEEGTVVSEMVVT